MKLARLAFILLMLLTGCDKLHLSRAISLPAASPTISAPTAAVSPTVAATQTPSGPVTLRVWLPPQFDPSHNTRASQLLQNRLKEFQSQHSNLRLEIRVKAIDGPGGMLEALTTASAAAPLALPDLIALPRPVLEAAALKGLLSPYDGLTNSITDPDWFDYARQLARLQNSTFGIPFAGDALALVYRPSITGSAPADWKALLALSGPFVFPLTDSQALCTLAFYQSSGGTLQDDQGRPALNPAILAQVLAFYQQAAKQTLLPASIARLETDEQAWQNFQQNQATLSITWASHYLAASGEQTKDMAAAPIPTLNGTPYTLANGWVWALPNHHPDRQAISVQLAEFLTQANFLAEWTSEAGFLPTRESALSAWKDLLKQSLAKKLILSSHLFPSSDVLSSLAPALRQAAVQMLAQGGDPVIVAQDAVKKLETP